MRRAYAPRRPVANEYLVRQRDRRRLRELGRVLLIVVPLGAALVLFIGLRLEVLDTAYEIRHLERTLHELDRQERELRLEAAYLESPRLLEERAVEELGMQPPQPGQTLFPEEDP